MAQGEGRTVERPESAAERRARLIGVARDVIADEGVAACTFRRLAKAAGSSTRPFTHTFGTRDALLREVALSTWEDSLLDVAHPVDPAGAPADWDPIAELERLGAHWLPTTDARTKAERVYLEIVLHCMTRPELWREILGFSDGANRQVALILEEGRRRGRIRDDLPVEDLVMAYWSYHAGLGLVAVYEAPYLPRERIDPLWRAGLEALLGPR